MDRSGAAGANQSLRGSIAELYATLKRSAAGGIVPSDVFVGATRELGLNEVERLRLADELVRLGLRISEPFRPPEGRSRPAETSLPRIELARRLFERIHADHRDEAARTVEGVIRLTGLVDQEAGKLRTLLLMTRIPSASVPDDDRIDDVGIVDEEAHAHAPADPGDVADAVSAARALLLEDRFAVRPQKRLLAADQEVGLSVLLRGGAERMNEEPTDEELAELDPTDERRRARECLILHNQGLVHSLVRHYPEQGLEYEDLAQHGMLGLMTAARKFDPGRGNKFSTYATWWIRQSLTRAIADEGSLIRIPVHMHELVQKVARAESRLLSQGRWPRSEDLAVACNVSVTKVDEVRRISRSTDSLDRIIAQDTTLGELLEARDAFPAVEHEVLAGLAEARMWDTINLLPSRYEQIVIRRLGLDGREAATLDEIGHDLDVTRERIRQLEAQVMPVLQLAYIADDDPCATLHLMLHDPWLEGRPNSVSAISRDLRKEDWVNGIAALRAFREQHSKTLPGEDDSEGGFSLGQWLAAQRRAGGRDGGGLPAHRRILLESLGVVWAQRPIY